MNSYLLTTIVLFASNILLFISCIITLKNNKDRTFAITYLAISLIGVVISSLQYSIPIIFIILSMIMCSIIPIIAISIPRKGFTITFLVFICISIIALLISFWFSYYNSPTALSNTNLSSDSNKIISTKNLDLQLISPDNKSMGIWLSDMSTRMRKIYPNKFKDIREINQLLNIIQYESSRAGLDPQLIIAMIMALSNFDPQMVSDNLAQGFMQISPTWVKQIGSPQINLYDPQTNIRFGCTILRHYLQKFNGNVYLAIDNYGKDIDAPQLPNRVFTAYEKYWAPSSTPIK